MIERFVVGDGVVFHGRQATVVEALRHPEERWRYQLYRIALAGSSVVVALDPDLAATEGA